jgi:acetylornithine deacetylase
MGTELLKKLVSIPSVSGSEEAIATYVFDHLTTLGFSPRRKGDNVWAEVGSGQGPRLLLVSHMDTVPPAAEWTRSPYEPTEVDGKIYGLGSNDAKASVSAMIEAVTQLKDESRKLNGSIVLALTCNEEMGRLGLETVIGDLKPLDGAIVGEPNGMEICVAQKGALVLNLTWKGKTAHSAHGTNDHAVRKCVEDLAALSKMTWPKIDPFLRETKLEITQVHAGERVNVIPDRAVATVDIRYGAVYDPEEILGMIRLSVRGEVGIYSDRRRAMRADPNTAIVRAAQKAQPKAELVGSRTSSDWVFLGDIPAIKMGPGSTLRSHTADEYVETSEFTRGIEIYRETIRNFFAIARS